MLADGVVTDVRGYVGKRPVRDTQRLQNPLHHWFSGLITEIIAFAAFVASTFFVVWLVMWLR